MSDIRIIWEIMDTIINDNHPTIYQYVKGKTKSKETAIMRVTGILAPIFQGAYDVSKIRGVAREFLKQKEKDFISGKLKVKSIY
jgi:hypothetical protein